MPFLCHVYSASRVLAVFGAFLLPSLVFLGLVFFSINKSQLSFFNIIVDCVCVCVHPSKGWRWWTWN